MKAPQIIYLILVGISLGTAIALRDKPKTGRNSLWISTVALIIQAGLLYWGGFFGGAA